MTIRPLHAVQILVLAAVYVAAARAGLMMDAVGGFATLVWPATGLSLGALLLLGSRLWPGVLIGAFVANVWTGAPVAVAVGIAAGNTLEALVGVWAMRRAGLRTDVARVRDVLVLVGIGAACAPVVSASVGVTSLALGGVITADHILETWRAWWLGDAMGAIVVTPVLLTLARPDRSRALESTVLALAVTGVGMFVFGGGGALSGLQQAYLVFPALVWAALRFGTRGAARATFLTLAIAIIGTTLGSGPFASEELFEGLLALQAFMAAVAITILLLGAASAERDEAVRKREQFLEVISHELKNPLSSVQLSAEVLLRAHPDDDRTQRRARAIQRAGDRMSTLIQNLLDLGALESGRIAIDARREPAASIVEEAVEHLRPLAGEREQTIEIKARIEDAVLCDRDRVLQIFANLVGNAIKFSPKQTAIEVALTSAAGYVQFSVRDRGPGLATDHAAHVFERYWRAPGAARQGSGLGLFICKGLVEAHGGLIWVESEPGSGSVFHFTLPVAS